MFDTGGDDAHGLIREGVAALAERDARAMSNVALSAAILAALTLAERLTAEATRLVGEWDTRRAWRDDGALSATSWLVHRAPVTRADALDLVRASRLARHHAATADALASGLVAVPHVAHMAEAAVRREQVFENEEEHLVDLASTQQPERFRETMRHWRNRADEQLGQSDDFDQSARCYLRGRPQHGSLVKVDGMFEADGWQTILGALQPFARPDPAPSVNLRSGGRRLADALVELAAQSLDAAARGEASGRPRLAVDVVIDYETLLRIGRGDLLGRRWDIEGLGAVPLAMVERLLCDCAVGRVLMRGKSEVLDLGRRTSVPSPAQRRALARRDEHCRFPGCDRPVRWTDAHHLVHWTRGGLTNLDNLVLLCRRHHRMCHEGRWELVRNPDGSLSAEYPRGRAPPVRAAA